jgi:restriction endonuclease Mrr
MCVGRKRKFDLLDTCPTFESFLYPLLKLAENGEVRVRESADVIAKQLNLTSSAMAELTKNGNALRYVDRTYWSATYLRQAEAAYKFHAMRQITID